MRFFTILIFLFYINACLPSLPDYTSFKGENEQNKESIENNAVLSTQSKNQSSISCNITVDKNKFEHGEFLTATLKANGPVSQAYINGNLVSLDSNQIGTRTWKPTALGKRGVNGKVVQGGLESSCNVFFHVNPFIPYEFGGMYGYGKQNGIDHEYNNPLTGTAGCPSGYNAVKTLGSTITNSSGQTTIKDYDLWYCVKTRVPGEVRNFNYAGGFGNYWNGSGSSQWPNPITNAGSCPQTYTLSPHIFGAANIDYGFRFCHKPSASSPMPGWIFGGFYSVKRFNIGNQYTNPLANQQLTCPAGFDAKQLFGDPEGLNTHVDNSLYSCIKPLMGKSSCIIGQSCVTAFRIVVLGSSTAFGAGASPIGNSYVNLFQDYLVRTINPQAKVFNLAKGGTNTFSMQPNSFTPPSPYQVDSSRNIDAAIALNPDAILINFPSNDVANGLSIEVQKQNFIRVTDYAKSKGKQVWVTSTQPRNFASLQQRQRLMEMRDWLQNSYGSKYIDFWTGLAKSDGTIHNVYDSGDGVHLNNAGHSLLVNRVIEQLAP